MPYKDPQKVREYQKKYREANREKLNKQCKDYYLQNRDKLLAKNRNYQDEHREEINKKSLEYYYTNKDEVLERMREYHKIYYEKNRDKLLELNKRYYKENQQSCTNRVRRNRHKRASWFRELKCQLECMRCGESHPACLDFHHKESKYKCVSKLINCANSESCIIEEIAKCEVLCSNCHRKLHYRIILPKENCCLVQKYRYARAEWFRKIKSELNCSYCNEGHPGCLDFHHINPKDKVKAVSKLVGEAASEKRILTEIAKCKPICSNCHRKLHYKG